MKSFTVKSLFSAAVALTLLSGCATTGQMTTTGISFIGNFTEGHAVTTNVASTRKGEACTTNILGIYASGDGSIDAAKKEGGITKVATVEKKVFAVIPFYGSVCTIVRGE